MREGEWTVESKLQQRELLSPKAELWAERDHTARVHTTTSTAMVLIKDYRDNGESNGNVRRQGGEKRGAVDSDVAFPLLANRGVSL